MTKTPSKLFLVRGHICHFPQVKIKGYQLLISLPEKGETGGVDPAGETGGDPFWYPGGFIIMMLRVTLIASSVDSSPNDLIFPPSDSDQI